MRYWYDTEFIEDGKTIDLISIGIVCEDGREYYAQSVEFDHRKASEWVQTNVLPHLTICPYTAVADYLSGGFAIDYIGTALRTHRHGQCIDQIYGIRHRCPWRTRAQLKRDIQIFFNPSDGIELWGYYSAYDHVAFAQLWGRMMDLPKGYPMYTRDIKQWCDALGNPRLPEQGKGEHNALEDARWNKQAWEFLDQQIIEIVR